MAQSLPVPSQAGAHLKTHPSHHVLPQVTCNKGSFVMLDFTEALTSRCSTTDDGSAQYTSAVRHISCAGAGISGCFGVPLLHSPAVPSWQKACSFSKKTSQLSSAHLRHVWWRLASCWLHSLMPVIKLSYALSIVCVYLLLWISMCEPQAGCSAEGITVKWLEWYCCTDSARLYVYRAAAELAHLIFSASPNKFFSRSWNFAHTTAPCCVFVNDASWFIVDARVQKKCVVFLGYW